MASGFGLSGGTSRCYPFWQELLACYVINTANENPESGKKCQPAMENYFECLNHKKEAERVAAIQAAYRKRMAQSSHEQPDPESIRNLGLLDKQQDTEKILALGKK